MTDAVSKDQKIEIGHVAVLVKCLPSKRGVDLVLSTTWAVSWPRPVIPALRKRQEEQNLCHPRLHGQLETIVGYKRPISKTKTTNPEH